MNLILIIAELTFQGLANSRRELTLLFSGPKGNVPAQKYAQRDICCLFKSYRAYCFILFYSITL